MNEKRNPAPDVIGYLRANPDLMESFRVVRTDDPFSLKRQVAWSILAATGHGSTNEDAPD